MIEVHVTLSREMFGTSVEASLTTDQVAHLVEGVRFTETMLKSRVDKDEMAKKKAHLRPVFFRSVVAKKALKAGTRLEKTQLTTKKPGTGLSAELLNDLVGRELATDVAENQLLREEDLV